LSDDKIKRLLRDEHFGFLFIFGKKGEDVRGHALAKFDVSAK
jgi:hypothetical protein